MLVLLQDGCPVPADVRPRDRLLVRLHASRLAVGPVSAQGVAQARALLADATSPVYHRASADNLRARVRAAVDALSPC